MEYYFSKTYLLDYTDKEQNHTHEFYCLNDSSVTHLIPIANNENHIWHLIIIYAENCSLDSSDIISVILGSLIRTISSPFSRYLSVVCLMLSLLDSAELSWSGILAFHQFWILLSLSSDHLPLNNLPSRFSGELFMLSINCIISVPSVLRQLYT